MFEKPNKHRSAIIGGLIIGAISGLPGLNFINCCCCAGIMLGGGISVYLYSSEFKVEMAPLESSDALILGIIAGIIGALLSTLIGVIIVLSFGPVEVEMARSFFERLTEKLENSGSVPAGTLDNLREQFDDAIKEASTVGGVLRSLIYSLIIYPIFSMLGGLICFSFFCKKKPTSSMPM